MAGIPSQHNGSMVDAHSVAILETLAPRLSSSDASIVRNSMEDGTLFPTLANRSDKDRLLRNLLAVEGMIPSLYTFFEYLKYLEPCAKIMRGILPQRCKRSIQTEFFASYFHPDRILVEYSQTDVRAIPPRSVAQDFSLAYHQLWLFALRNFTSMTDATPRKESSREKPLVAESNPLVWQRFGVLAISVGLRTVLAEALAAKDGLHDLAQQVLLKTECHVPLADSVVEDMTAVLRRLEARKTPSLARPSWSGDECLPKERRCGRPFLIDHSKDRDFLFLPFVHEDGANENRDVSTYYCKWHMFRVFFAVETVSSRFLSSCYNPL